MEGCGANCIKFLLMMINFIIAICGMGLIATGLLIKYGLTDWVPIDDLASLLDSQLLRSATYIIIGAGGFVFLISILGCLGAMCENKCILVLYFLMLFIVFAGQIAAGILAALYTRQIESYLKNESMEFLGTNFNSTEEKYILPTQAWIYVQQRLRCCGVTGSNDYAGNTHMTAMTPDSCCNGVCTMTTYQQGCSDSIKELISDYGTIIGATAVGVAFFELCCMLLAICVCRNVTDDS